MRYSISDIFHLLRTPLGRRQLEHGILYRMWPVFYLFARFYRNIFIRKVCVVAVIGSFGKSSTVRSISAVLGVRIHSKFYLNSYTSAAAAILRIKSSNRYAVIEVGINGPDQMKKYARLIKPDVVVVTSIGTEHLSSLGSLEITRSEKSDMLKKLSNTGLAILNGDDSNVRWMAEKTSARIITIGMEETNDISATDIRLDWPKGMRFKIRMDEESYDINIRLLGLHMVVPVLAAVAVAREVGITIDQTIRRLRDLKPTSARLEPVRLNNGVVIIRDEYKSTLETIERALDIFEEIPARRKLIVLGEVSEPPGSQGPIYWSIGERIASIVSLAIFIGGNFQRYASGAARKGFPRSSLINAKKSISKAVEVLQNELQSGDVVLIKGRDTQRLDRIYLSLIGKDVHCSISFCNAKLRCELCPMLERGWEGMKVVI